MPSAEASPAESPTLAELFSRLPVEILGLILEQTAQMIYFRKDVAPLCLVSKTFLPRIQRELYHKASVNYKRWDVDEDEQPIDPQPELEVEDAIRHTLKRAPHLRPLVRHLNIFVEFWSYTEEDELGVLLSMQKVLRLCPHLTELSVDHHAAWEATDDVAATVAELERLPPIETLEISHVGPGVIALLKQLPHLRNRHLSIPVFRNDDPLDIPPSFPCSLTSLSCVDSPLRLFCPLTSDSFATLANLTVGSDVLAEEAVQKFLPNFIALHRLHVVYRSEDHDHSQSTALAISLLPQLQHLSVYAPETRALHPSRPHPFATALLLRLPPSLRDLDLHSTHTHPDSIIQLFHHRDITPPPKLKIIRLGRDVQRALERDR